MGTSAASAAGWGRYQQGCSQHAEGCSWSKLCREHLQIHARPGWELGGGTLMELVGPRSEPIPVRELDVAGGVGMPSTFLAADRGKSVWI